MSENIAMRLSDIEAALKTEAFGRMLDRMYADIQVEDDELFRRLVKAVKK